MHFNPILPLVYLLLITLPSILSQPFYAVQDLDINFHALSPLTAQNRHQLLSQQNPDVDSVAKLLRAECLFEYLATGQRSQHCLKTLPNQTSSSQNRQNNANTRNSDDYTGQKLDTLASEGDTASSLHPLLLPLYDHTSDELFENQSSFDAQGVRTVRNADSTAEMMQIQELREKYVTTSSLPPFGESISVSFTLAIPSDQRGNSGPQEGAQFETQSSSPLPFSSQSIQTSTFFDFKLNLESDGVTHKTRVHLVDNEQHKTSNNPISPNHPSKVEFSSNSQPPGHNDQDNLDAPMEASSTRSMKEYITHSFGTLGSTYSGKILQEDGTFSTLLLTIFERGRFEGILYHNAIIYAIQPPDMVLPTYTSIQTALQTGEFTQQDSTHNEADKNNNIDFLSLIDAAINESTTVVNSNQNSFQSLDNRQDQYQKLKDNLSSLYTPLTSDSSFISTQSSQDIDDQDLPLISSLFLLSTPLQQLKADQVSQLSTLDLVKSNQASFIATSTEHFAMMDGAHDDSNHSNQDDIHSDGAQDMIKKNLNKSRKIWSCGVMDPNTNELVDEAKEEGSTAESRDSFVIHQNFSTSNSTATATVTTTAATTTTNSGPFTSQSDPLSNLHNVHKSMSSQSDVSSDPKFEHLHESMFSQRPQLTRWTNCIKEKDNTYFSGHNRLHIGFVVDYGAYIAANRNIGNIVARIQSAIAWGNNFYPQQIGLYLTIDQITIMTSLSASGPSWNNDGPSQSLTTERLLLNLSSYRQSKHPRDFAVLQLMTNAFPPPGTVGLAYLSSVGVGRAVSWATLSNFYFLTAIHEHSHNYGLAHTFGPNEGSIMSYDLSGRIGSTDPDVGQVGLNQKTSKGQLCGYLSKVRQGMQSSDASTRVPVEKIFSPYNGPVCGNGLLEEGEECDAGLLNGVASPRGKVCCTTSCQLTAGSTCAPNYVPNSLSIVPTVAEDSECCIECEAQTMLTPCGAMRSTGYCGRDGICVVSGCNAMNGIIPCNAERFTAENPCIQQCNAMNQTNMNQCYTLSYATPHVYAQHGSQCVYMNGTRGMCLYENFPTDTNLFHQRPIPGENFITLEQVPHCVPFTHKLTITNNDKMGPCGCDGYSTVMLSCLQNDMNYIPKDVCIYQHNQWYPPSSYVKCTPPPYCKL